MTRSRLLLGLGIAAAIAVGCSVIVPGDVPDFQCTGASATACPSGMVCDTTTGKCVADAGGLVEEDAGEDAGTDAPDDVRVDVDAGPAPVGSPCRVASDCASKICGTDTFLTPTMTAGTGPVCTQPCCTSADCPGGTICFGGGTGGNYCVAAEKAQRSPPKTGGKTPGTSCTANSECRSGLCQLNRCLDTCCDVAECAAGTTCRVASLAMPSTGPLHDIWVCAPAPPASTKNVGESCKLVDDCKNDNCVGSDAGPEPRVCRPSCCSKSDCTTQLGATTHCGYSTSNNDQIKFCFFATTGSTANGSSCGGDTECQSAFCDDGTGTCKTICCVDSDCAASEACRPSPKGFLRCIAK